MKLESVDKVLVISIDGQELSAYINALDRIITKNDERTSDWATLKKLSVELTRVLKNARDF